MNPDEVFTYKVPRSDMDSDAAIREMTGSMTFTFIDASKVRLQDYMSKVGKVQNSRGFFAANDGRTKEFLQFKGRLIRSPVF